jgi:hypothetical protein
VQNDADWPRAGGSRCSDPGSQGVMDHQRAGTSWTRTTNSSGISIGCFNAQLVNCHNISVDVHTAVPHALRSPEHNVRRRRKGGRVYNCIDTCSKGQMQHKITLEQQGMAGRLPPTFSPQHPTHLHFQQVNVIHKSRTTTVPHHQYVASSGGISSATDDAQNCALH